MACLRNFCGRAGQWPLPLPRQPRAIVFGSEVINSPMNTARTDVSQPLTYSHNMSIRRGRTDVPVKCLSQISLSPAKQTKKHVSEMILPSKKRQRGSELFPQPHRRQTKRPPDRSAPSGQRAAHRRAPSHISETRSGHRLPFACQGHGECHAPWLRCRAETRR